MSDQLVRGKSAGLRNAKPRIVALSAVLWIVAACLAGLVAPGERWLADARWGPWESFFGLALAFALAEVFVVHLRIRTEAHTFSLIELPLAIGLFFVPPVVLVAAQLVGGLTALAFYRKQGALKLLFNGASFALCVVLAITVFRSFDSFDRPIGTAALLHGGFALVVASIVSVCLVYVVISLSSGSWRLHDLQTAVAFGLVTAFVTASLGVIAVVVLDAQPGVSWLLLVPAVGVYLANWAYTTQRRRHASLDFLYQSTQLLHQSEGIESTIVELLRHTNTTFNTACAELIYVSDAGSLVVSVGPDDEVHAAHALDNAHHMVLSLGSSHRTQILHPGVDAEVDRFLAMRGYRNAVVASLISDSGAVGALVMANRLSQVESFDNTDAQLAETLAHQTATALENGRLEQSLEQLRILEGQLTFQALHDPLTGLANRTLFRDSLTSLVESDGPKGAVLFIDLDDFKTVNDSFGHASGDALLNEVADRLQRSLDDGDVIARLGGDEFAILLPWAADLAGATRAAEQLLRSFEKPVQVAEHMLSISASIGIAMVGPASEPEALMRNADTAMYTAKAQGKHRIVSFEPEMYETNLHRFNLHFDLQRAVELGELDVVFQPIVRMGDRLILGAEALIRWQHPTLGLIAPDSFLGVAQQSGLMAEIDTYVLDRSCHWLAELDETRPGLVPAVAVNISPRSFQDARLVGIVEERLRHYRLSPGRLSLEITENLMTQHVDEAMGVLTRLKALGVRLALDDFGTGYSSLSYLHSLPVDVVKIAKPFIDDLEVSSSQRAFTTAIVALGAALDKFVVAEGIERTEQLTILEAAGCGGGQGYLFAKPMSTDAFVQWADGWSNGAAVTPLSSARSARLRAFASKA